MKTINAFAATWICCLIATTTIADDKAVDPSGTWRWEYEFQGETVKDSLQLNLKEDGKVVGTFKGRNNTVKVKEGKVEGDKLTVAFPVDFQGTELNLTFSGQLNGDDVDGTVIIEANGESREFPWKPKRSVKMEDVVGTWQIRIESSNGTVFEPTMKISNNDDKYESVYTTKQGQELDVSDLRVEENHLMFTVTAEFDGNTLKVDYKGRPYGDNLKGTLGYDYAGTTGEAEFVGTRKR